MATERKAPAKNKKQSRSFILTLALILVVGYFIITIIDLQLEIRDRKEVYEQLGNEYEQIVSENNRLQAIVDNEDKSAYMEQVAREKLGFVMPNEKVFYDITPGA